MSGEERSGEDPTTLQGAERERWLKQRRRRNWAIFAALVTFIVVVYFVAMVRMGGLAGG